MTLKDIETIISHPDILERLEELKEEYSHRLDNEASHDAYKRDLKMFSFRVKSAQLRG